MEERRSDKRQEILYADESNSGSSQLNIDSVKCALPRSDNKHFQLCEIVALGQLMREQQELMFQPIPQVCDKNARDVVKFMLGSNCEDFVLNGTCDNKLCSSHHSGMLEFNPPWCDGALSFKIFSKWYLHNSKQPNFKILLHLLSSVSYNAGAELYLLILSFSRLLLKIRQDLRKPLGLSLIEKLVNCIGLTKPEAIRLILVFLVERENSDLVIMDIVNSLGVFDQEMRQLYQSISCIWHINDTFTFPKSVQFMFMQECIKNVPMDIKFTRDKIIIEVLKIPRKDTIRKYTLVDKFLRTFYPQNSIVANQTKTIILFGGSIQSVVQSSTNVYKSSKVKSSSTVNYKWSYWDVKEAQRNGFKLVLGQNDKKTDNKASNTYSKLKLAQLEDNCESSPDEIMAQILNKGQPIERTLETKKAMIQIESMFDGGMFENVALILQANHRKGVDECLSLVANLMLTLHPNKIPNVVHDIMMSQAMCSSLHKSFIETINSLSVTFYQKRDYISGIKLLKTLRVCGVNPCEFTPQGLNTQLFLIICSDIHYETRCYREAVQILHYGGCFKLLTGCKISEENFDQLERVVIKFLKGFVAGKMSSYALDVFRSTVEAQKDLFEPINVARFYESVLCNTFVTVSKAPCNTHDGANLYILVDKLCGNVKFRPVTYRGLLCLLVDVEASESIVRRTLRLCIKTGAYRPFRSTCLEVGSHFALQEMKLYVRHYFQYFVAQDEGSSLPLASLPFSIYKDSSPLTTTLPIYSLIENTNEELSEAVERFKLAIKEIAGDVDVPMEFTSLGKGFFITSAIMALLDVPS